MDSNNFSQLLNSLYEPSIAIKLKLIKTLENQTKWCSLKELKLLSGYTEPTIKKYLSEFKRNTFYTEDFLLKYDKDKGYFLKIKDKFNFTQYYRDILYKTWPMQFIKELILHGSVNKLIFEANYFISDSVFKRKLTQIREILVEFDITLKTKQKRYYFSGKEANIRRLSESFFWEFFKGAKWPFENVNQEKIISLANILLKNPTKLSLIEKRKFHYHLAIQELRYNSGYFFKIDDNLRIYFPFFKQFISNINTYEDYFPCEEEAYYVYFWMLTNSRYYDYFNINFNISDIKNEKVEELALINFQIIEYCAKNIGELTIRKKRDLLNYLISTHVNLLLYGNIHTISDNQYPLFNNKNMEKHLNNILSIIETKVAIPLPTEIKSFLSYRYEIILSEVYPVALFDPPIFISFCTDLDFVLESKLLRILKLYFSDIANVSFFSGIDAQMKSIDLVVHTSLSTDNFLEKNVKRAEYIDIHYLDISHLSSLIYILTEYISTIKN